MLVVGADLEVVVELSALPGPGDDGLRAAGHDTPHGGRLSRPDRLSLRVHPHGGRLIYRQTITVLKS